jgi:hypothetical protein
MLFFIHTVLNRGSLFDLLFFSSNGRSVICVYDFQFIQVIIQEITILYMPTLPKVNNMKLTIAILSILAFNTGATIKNDVMTEKRRNLDEEEYYYPVENFKMDEEYYSTKKCDQDTLEVEKEIMLREDYMILRENIQDTGFHVNETNTYIVVSDVDLNASFQEICEDSGGWMVSADLFYESDKGDSNTCSSDSLVNYSHYPICVAKSCEDGSQTVLGVLAQNLEISTECDPEIIIAYVDYSEPEPLLSSDDNVYYASILEQLLLEQLLQSDDDTYDSSTLEQLLTSDDSGILRSKSAKRAKSNPGKESREEDRSGALQCVADMARIHGDVIGANPIESRDFLFENLVECDGSKTGTSPSCTYNGNSAALEIFTIDCESLDGRVIQTDWAFTDGCDIDVDDDFDFFSDWVGTHECVSASCSDDAAIDFFNSIYFDPNDTSCYVNVSVKSMKTLESGKTSKGTKTIKKVVKKVKKGAKNV